MPMPNKFPLDRQAIKECIPHREPFLLVDLVSEAKPLEFIKAERFIDPSDPVFKGHFPDFPVYPGVLIVEGLAQGAAILGHLTSETGLKECLLTELTNTRFRKPVLPGQTLHYEVKYLKHRAPFFWFEATATVENQVVATVNLSAIMRSK